MVYSIYTLLIFIRLITGNTHQLQVDKYDTILLLKFRIRRLLGIPTYLQSLYRNGSDTPLNDDLTLDNYTISDHSTLRLVTKMKTGFIL